MLPEFIYKASGAKSDCSGGWWTRCWIIGSWHRSVDSCPGIAWAEDSCFPQAPTHLPKAAASNEWSWEGKGSTLLASVWGSSKGPPQLQSSQRVWLKPLLQLNHSPTSPSAHFCLPHLGVDPGNMSWSTSFQQIFNTISTLTISQPIFSDSST